MENNFNRTLPVMSVSLDRNQNAMPPGVLYKPENRPLAALEPAPIAVECLEDECFEVSKMIIDDAVHFSCVTFFVPLGRSASKSQQARPNSVLRGRHRGAVAAKSGHDTGQLVDVAEEDRIPTTGGRKIDC